MFPLLSFSLDFDRLIPLFQLEYLDNCVVVQ